MTIVEKCISTIAELALNNNHSLTLLVTVLSVLRFTADDCPFGTIDLFLQTIKHICKEQVNFQ
jgi:hypothetical protein